MSETTTHTFELNAKEAALINDLRGEERPAQVVELKLDTSGGAADGLLVRRAVRL